MNTNDKLNLLNMPSIEDLETSLRGKRLLGNLLGVHGPPTPRGKQIADGYVRLVEKTMLEYTSARDRFIAYMQNGSFDDYARAQDHFESCVHSLHRAIAYLERLRQMGFRGENGSPFIPRPRDLGVLREDVQTKVRHFRDLSEHIDEDILCSRIPENAEVAIHLGWDRASLADAEIRYEDITNWICQLHQFAVLLSRIIVNNPG